MLDLDDAVDDALAGRGYDDETADAVRDALRWHFAA